MIYGYARVSTYGLTLEAQVYKLTAAGCSKIYREKESGTKADRRELQRLLKALELGDEMLVTRIDRLSRSTFDLFTILKTVTEAGARFRCIEQPEADTGSKFGELILAMLGWLGRTELDLIKTRTAERRARANARGQHMGSPPASPRAKPQRPGSAVPIALRSQSWQPVTTLAALLFRDFNPLAEGPDMRPMTYAFVALATFMVGGTALASQPYTFVYEYLETLAQIEQIRDAGKKDLKDAPNTVFSVCIENGTKFQLEFNGSIAGLQTIDLGQNMAKHVIPGLIAFYQQEIAIYDEMISGCQKMLVPKAGVDYGQLAADAPKLTAMLDYVDQGIFKATPLIFATLIDPNPDKQGHVSRLVISANERQNLVNLLDIYFGKKMQQTDQNWLVSSATVLQTYLTKKNYKAADER